MYVTLSPRTHASPFISNDNDHCGNLSIVVVGTYAQIPTLPSRRIEIMLANLV